MSCPWVSRFCARCGLTLTVEAAKSLNTVIRAAEAVVANPNDPEARAMMNRKLSFEIL